MLTTAKTKQYLAKTVYVYYEVIWYIQLLKFGSFDCLYSTITELKFESFSSLLPKVIRWSNEFVNIIYKQVKRFALQTPHMMGDREIF